MERTDGVCTAERLDLRSIKLSLTDQGTLLNPFKPSCASSFHSVVLFRLQCLKEALNHYG